MFAGAETDKIIKALQDKIQQAQDLHEKSKEDFRKVATSPTASPHEIARAFEVECAARNARVEAIARLNQFLATKMTSRSQGSDANDLVADEHRRSAASRA